MIVSCIAGSGFSLTVFSKRNVFAVVSISEGNGKELPIPILSMNQMKFPMTCTLYINYVLLKGSGQQWAMSDFCQKRVMWRAKTYTTVYFRP